MSRKCLPPLPGRPHPSRRPGRPQPSRPGRPQLRRRPIRPYLHPRLLQPRLPSVAATDAGVKARIRGLRGRDLPELRPSCASLIPPLASASTTAERKWIRRNQGRGSVERCGDGADRASTRAAVGCCSARLHCPRQSVLLFIISLSTREQNGRCLNCCGLTHRGIREGAGGALCCPASWVSSSGRLVDAPIRGSGEIQHRADMWALDSKDFKLKSVCLRSCEEG